MPLLTGQRTQFQLGGWGGRAYGNFAKVAPSVGDAPPAAHSRTFFVALESRVFKVPRRQPFRVPKEPRIFKAYQEAA